MTFYTYFVITPGVDVGSFVRIPTAPHPTDIIYFKFGDSKSTNTGLGIRNAYKTHNPNIGVGAVMEDELAKEYLGTQIKNDLVAFGVPKIDKSEWFYVEPAKAIALFMVINNKWDNKKVTDAIYPKLLAAIQKALS